MEASSTKAVGNGAKLREAYEFAEEFLRDYGTDWKLHNRLCDMLKSAIAAPPRNCDAFSKAEVLKELEDRSFSKEDTIEWLYSTAEEREGGNNGGK